MSLRFSSRFGVAALALGAVLILSSCNKKSDQSVSSDSSTPSTTTSESSSTPASSPASSSTQKLGTSPQGTNCPSGNPVKAVTSKKLGKIYLTTQSPQYKTIKPDKCFPDVNAAKQAGYGASK
jgi:hypothetical protein